jgi:hypothetical protein
MHLNTISWKAIFAGTFISVLAYLILATLGLAIGGSSLGIIIQNGLNAGGLGVGTGIWLAFSALVSLFFGSFAASRSSRDIFRPQGAIQGLVIASLFFLFLFSQVGGAVAVLGRGLGGTVGLLGGAVGDLADNPEVRDTVENALGSQGKLRAPMRVVASGLASRLLRGDTKGARDYLALQTGVTPAEADQRIVQIQRDLTRKLKGLGTTTAKAISVTGWSLFSLLVLGSIFAALGGRAGAPLLVEAVERKRREVEKGKRAA